MKIDREYWAWCDEAKERFDERIAILSDGGKVSWQMDRIARMEARMVHVHAVAERACSGAVDFSVGTRSLHR